MILPFPETLELSETVTGDDNNNIGNQAVFIRYLLLRAMAKLQS
jgi:hypothetical protein